WQSFSARIAENWPTRIRSPPLADPVAVVYLPLLAFSAAGARFDVCYINSGAKADMARGPTRTNTRHDAWLRNPDARKKPKGPSGALGRAPEIGPTTGPHDP